MAQGVLKNGREVGVKMLENLKRDIKDFEREITAIVADLHHDNILKLSAVADAEFQLRGGLVLPPPYPHSFLHLFFLFFSHISPLISMEVLGSRGARAPL